MIYVTTLDDRLDDLRRRVADVEELAGRLHAGRTDDAYRSEFGAEMDHDSAETGGAAQAATDALDEEDVEHGNGLKRLLERVDELEILLTSAMDDLEAAVAAREKHLGGDG